MLRLLRQHLHERRQDRLAGEITLEAARERVARGAATLDASDPGWPSRINPATLELSDGAHCVLGQLHGEFRAGLLRTRIWDASSAPRLRLLSATSPEDLGFHARRDGGEGLAALDYAFLNRAWREEVVRRTARPGTQPARAALATHPA